MASSTKDPDKASNKAIPDCTEMATAGVWKRGWTFANTLCPNPSWANAYRYRGPTKVEFPTLPKIEIIAPRVMITAKAGPPKCAADSANGDSDWPKSGKVPT